MRGWVVQRYGKGTPLRLVDLPDPVVGDGDVLIEVHAAALNPLDSKIRDGAFKLLLPYKPPFVLGHDVAGRVFAVGRSVRGFAIGDEVYARPRDGRIGTLAERIAVPAEDVAPAPANVSLVEAASLPLVALTASQALVDIGRVGAGSRLLIHAGAGGVGTIAIQLAKHLGATVATTASSAGEALVRSLGADTVIDYRTQDFTDQLRDQDFVLANQDAKTLVRSLNVMAPGGTLVSLSGPPDPAFARAQGMNPVMRFIMGLLSLGVRRKARARGVDYRFLFMRADGAQLARITTLVEAGTIKPVIDRRFGFDAVNDAMAYLDSGHAKGKVVIDVATTR
ncbi:NADPH:quinone oxidoreductase [Sphingomonas ginsenosidimutans]|uniref:NADPH:quinone oxidoreductase n=1 Tax=Sphingomonas ginsenosidimutans TaxID=862134 RepID=A0A2A4HZJ6_9SPHN|nr:NADP-dependent oxidoreductase [Sphingomonas ginsenosidimutans]PCG09956.1 NADPH:quinone oxidoreductase [Sphingomonas ginsenosidimutans]